MDFLELARGRASGRVTALIEQSRQEFQCKIGNRTRRAPSAGLSENDAGDPGKRETISLLLTLAHPSTQTDASNYLFPRVAHQDLVSGRELGRLKFEKGPIQRADKNSKQVAQSY
jgi:hypothetical protein